MVKSNMLKKRNERELEDDFDFSEIMNSPDDEAIAGVMHGLIEASNNQMALAIELTKLVISKSPDKNMNEDDIFSVFKKASETIAESFPLKALWEKFSTND